MGVSSIPQIAQVLTTGQKLASGKFSAVQKDVGQSVAQASFEWVTAKITSGRDLSFSYDSDLDMVIVQVRDGDTNAVITQIPSSKSVEFAHNFCDVLGKIINRRI